LERIEREPGKERERFRFMRSLLAATALLLSQVLPLSALAQGMPERTGPTQIDAGTIVWLDPVSMNFVMQGQTNARQYWATRATRFRANKFSPTFFDLAVGQSVEVVFHDSGRLEIADVVTY
jgi:hypothetical protein